MSTHNGLFHNYRIKDKNNLADLIPLIDCKQIQFTAFDNECMTFDKLKRGFSFGFCLFRSFFFCCRC